MSRNFNRFMEREISREKKKVVKSKPIQKLMLNKESIENLTLFQKVVYYTRVVSGLIDKTELICGNSISFLQEYNNVDLLEGMVSISTKGSDEYSKAIDYILSAAILSNEGSGFDLWYVNFCATVSYLFVVSDEYKLLPLASYEDSCLFAAINGNLVDASNSSLQIQNKYKVQKLWKMEDISYSRVLMEFELTEIGSFAQDNYLTSITIFNSVITKHIGITSLIELKREVKEYSHFQQLARNYRDKCVSLEDKLSNIRKDNEERLKDLIKSNKDLSTENSSLYNKNRKLEFELLKITNRLNILEDKLEFAESLLPESDFNKVEGQDELDKEYPEDIDVDLSKAVLIIDYNADNFKGWLPTYSYKGAKNDLKRLNKYNLAIFVTSEMSHKYFWAVKDYCDKIGIEYIYTSRVNKRLIIEAVKDKYINKG